MWHRHQLALVLIALAAWSIAASAAPDCPPHAPPTVRLMVHEPALIAARLDAMLEVGNGRSARLAALRRLFAAAGCALEEQRATEGQMPNLVCTLAGQLPDTIVVGGSFYGDGDASAALLPSLYESLAAAPRRHTLKIVAFTPRGRGGMRFVDALSPAAREKLAAMVHVGPLGYGPPQPHPVNADDGLQCDLMTAARTLGMTVPPRPIAPFGDTFAGPYAWMPLTGNAHWLTFRRAGVPVISIHSGDGKTLAPRFDFDAYYAQYRLLAVFIALIDSREAKRSSAA